MNRDRREALKLLGGVALAMGVSPLASACRVGFHRFPPGAGGPAVS